MANIHTTRLLTHPRTLHFDSPGIGTAPFRRFRLGGGDLLDLPVRAAQASPLPTAAPSAFGTSVLNFKIGSILGELVFWSELVNLGCLEIGTVSCFMTMLF
jgi:hypothetical protein